MSFLRVCDILIGRMRKDEMHAGLVLVAQAWSAGRASIRGSACTESVGDETVPSPPGRNFEFHCICFQRMAPFTAVGTAYVGESVRVEELEGRLEMSLEHLSGGVESACRQHRKGCPMVCIMGACYTSEGRTASLMEERRNRINK